MGDRFYEQQGKHKPKRVLKRDIIAKINKLFDEDIVGLEKATIPTLEQLLEALNDK
jgi:hypothetical protein